MSRCRNYGGSCICSFFLLLNEGFGEHFTGDEKIVFYPNEHLISQPDGREQERITDTCFEIQGAQIKKYHIECQSTTDASMLMRMFEYDTQIALNNGTVDCRGDS